MERTPQVIQFDLPDVTLGGLIWEAGPEAPIVVAIHGITANAWTWAPTARLLGTEVTLIAVDVRGRGRSASAPPPYGITQHGHDVAAIIDAHSSVPVVLAGHSMGTYVAMACAEHHPHLVSQLILVDGAVALPLPEGSDAQEILDATLGPSLARLRQSWPEPDSYLEMWQSHPAFAAGLTPEMKMYVMDDLVRGEGGWVSKVSEEAVRTDGADLLLDAEVRSSLDRQTHPITMIRAERGILAQPTPLIPAEQVKRYRQHRWITVPESNHYDVLMGEAGAQAVATAITEALT
jgi:pimeloyl-ACP methyl ester carboxylesterase